MQTAHAPCDEADHGCNIFLQDRRVDRGALAGERYPGTAGVQQWLAVRMGEHCGGRTRQAIAVSQPTAGLNRTKPRVVSALSTASLLVTGRPTAVRERTRGLRKGRLRRVEAARTCLRS